MALTDDDPLAPVRKPSQGKPSHEIGQNLDTLSVDELAERVELLRAEIERLEKARVAKQASRAAADAFFKI